MLELLQSPEHVVAIRVKGQIEEADVDKAIQAVEAALDKEPRISFYAEMGKLEGMTGAALAKDLRYGLSMLRQADRLARAAVVTDEEWIRSLARFESWLIPTLELKLFSGADNEQALAWASEPPPALPPVDAREPSIRMIETTEPKVLAFELDGYVTGDDIAGVAYRFEAAFKQHEKVHVFARIKRLSGVDVASVAQERTVSLKLKALQHVERYAVVGGPQWVQPMVGLLDPLFVVEVRHFGAEAESEAWSWLGAQPAGGS